MLKITRRQVEAFAQGQLDALAERIAARLRESFPELQATSDDDLAALVQHGIARAEHHGIRSTREISDFVGLVAALGPDFDTDGRCPWAAAILADEQLDAIAKVSLLYDRALLEEP